jgi:hypothetical protein
MSLKQLLEAMILNVQSYDTKRLSARMKACVVAPSTSQSYLSCDLIG